MTLYGYYSQKQYEANGITYIYKNISKKEIHLTQVSNKLLSDTELTKIFSDNIFMGEVLEYVRNESSTVKDKLNKFV